MPSRHIPRHAQVTHVNSARRAAADDGPDSDSTTAVATASAAPSAVADEDPLLQGRRLHLPARGSAAALARGGAGAGDRSAAAAAAAERARAAVEHADACHAAAQQLSRELMADLHLALGMVEPRGVINCMWAVSKTQDLCGAWQAARQRRAAAAAGDDEPLPPPQPPQQPQQQQPGGVFYDSKLVLTWLSIGFKPKYLARATVRELLNLAYALVRFADQGLLELPASRAADAEHVQGSRMRTRAWWEALLRQLCAVGVPGDGWAPACAPAQWRPGVAAASAGVGAGAAGEQAGGVLSKEAELAAEQHLTEWGAQVRGGMRGGAFA